MKRSMSVLGGFRSRLIPVLFAIAATGWLVAGPAPGIAQQAAVEQAAGLEVLDLEDYPRWSRIGNVALSPNGAWMAYSYDPLDGDNTLFVRQLDGDTVHESTRASGPQFADDSRWVAFMVSDEDADGDGGRGGRGGNGNGGGGRDATLLELAGGETFTTADAASFEFSEDGAWFVVKRQRADREAEHEGSDLVLRDLATGVVQNIGNVDEFAFNEQSSMLAYTVDAAGGTGNGLYVLDLAGRALQPLDTSEQRYARLAWNEGGTAVAVLRGAVDDELAQRANVLLAFRSAADGFERTTFDPQSAANFPDGMVLSELRSLDWSDDGSRIFVGIKEQAAGEPEEEEEEDGDEGDDEPPTSTSGTGATNACSRCSRCVPAATGSRPTPPLSMWRTGRSCG